MIKRRDFLHWVFKSFIFSAALPSRLGASPIFSPDTKSSSEKEKILDILINGGFPFPYDENYFECAERIYNLRPSADGRKWQANLNLVIKRGRVVDLKILMSQSLEGLEKSNRVIELSGVSDIVDLNLEGEEDKRAYYQVLYREGKENWKSLAPKSFKLPFVNLEKGESIKIIFIGDDHTFDDADYEVPEEFKGSKLSGDFMPEFIRGLVGNADWKPKKPLGTLKNSFYLAQAIRYILVHEEPDLIILMGDTTGLGSFHKWPGLGLPNQNLLSDSDFNSFARLFWLRMRKLYSALTPFIPVFIVLGNHDGEAQWNLTSKWGTFWREKLFALPRATTYAEGGHPEGKYYAFSWGADNKNRGGVLVIALNTTAFSGSSFPTKIEDWSLGQEQRLWLEKTLQEAEKHWIFICAHHVLGGWPAGPEETRRDIVYGRGPLFTAEDYKEYATPEKIEQVWVTQKAMENGARAFIYGHDHIFYSKRIGHGLNDLEMQAICCGSTKYVGEKIWWGGPLWRKHYGSSNKMPPDFWGPSGITRTTIKAEEATFEYIMTGWTAHSNLPPHSNPGKVLRTTILSNPPPKLSFSPEVLSFRCIEEEANPEEKFLIIKNAGSGRLEFRLKTKASWLKINPHEGESWGREKIIKISIYSTLVEEGKYDSTIEIESPQMAQQPAQVKVVLVVDPPPLYPPLKLTGKKKIETRGELKKNFIILSWLANPSNKKIEGYRVYISENGRWTCLGEVAKNKRNFTIEKFPAEPPWKFGVCAFDKKNRESEMATVIIR